MLLGSNITGVKATIGDGDCFILRGTNGKFVGKSEMYSTPQAMENGIEAVKLFGPGAPVEDLAEPSASMPVLSLTAAFRDHS